MVGRAGAAAAVTAAALLLAGCGSSHGSGGAADAAAPAASPPPLSTSFSASTGLSWAVVEMGGSSAQQNNFWQLFARSAPAASWKLVTPVAVADNGGLVVATTGPQSLVTGFRPSQDLTFSPITATSDGGARWSQGAPVDPGLANAPDALAAAPDGKLIALTTAGGAQVGTPLGAAWSGLSSIGALGAAPAGKACGLTRLTAAAFGPGGAPLLAGDCAKPGMAGIFALRGGRWQAAGPSLPPALARSGVGVLALSTSGKQTTALLQVGSGPDAGTLAAWSAAGGPPWSLSAPLRTGSAGLRSAALWAGGAAALVQAGNRGATIAGPGASWLQLPALPAGTQTLAAGPAGQLDALVTAGSKMTDWRLARGSTSWKVAQTVQVAIPYGSSG
jgi:hypothetical protein